MSDFLVEYLEIVSLGKIQIFWTESGMSNSALMSSPDFERLKLTVRDQPGFVFRVKER